MATKIFPPTPLRLWHALCLLIFLAAFGYAAFLGFTRPYHNWDMLAYVGSAISWSEPDTQRLYDKAMTDVNSVVGPEHYKNMSTSILSNNPESFRQQLPFYTVKPLYVALVFALHRMGSTYGAATWHISVFSFLALGLVLALWRSRLDYGVWLLAIVVLSCLGEWPMLSLARFSTPDALATTLIMAALFFLLKRRSLAAFIGIGAASILARPDALVLLVLASAFVYCAREEQGRFTLKQTTLAIAIFVAVYVTVQVAAGGYGWTKLFYYTFIEKLSRPAETSVHLTPATYVEVLRWGVRNILSDVRLMPMLVLSMLAVFCHFMRPAAGRVWPWVLALAWISYGVRIALFPAWWEYRYYYVNYLIALTAIAEMTPPYVLARWQWLRARWSRLNPNPHPAK